MSQDVLLRHGPEAPFGRYDKPQAPKWMDIRLSYVRSSVSLTGGRPCTIPISQTLPSTALIGTLALLAVDRLSPDAREHIGLLVYSRTEVKNESTALRNTISSAVLSGQSNRRLAARPPERNWPYCPWRTH